MEFQWFSKMFELYSLQEAYNLTKCVFAYMEQKHMLYKISQYYWQTKYAHKFLAIPPGIPFTES